MTPSPLTLLIAVPATLYLASGIAATTRLLTQPTVEATPRLRGKDLEVLVRVTTSGRMVASVKVELVEAGRRAPLASRDVRGTRWGYWNPFPVREEFAVRVPGRRAEARVRVSAQWGPVWLTWPDPVVVEVALPDPPAGDGDASAARRVVGELVPQQDVGAGRDAHGDPAP
jgi:hypothetical protein